MSAVNRGRKFLRPEELGADNGACHEWHVDIPKGQIGIFADHDSSLRGVVGHGTAVVRDNALIVAGSITPVTDVARQVIELAKSGFDPQASVGVNRRLPHPSG
ncbi:MAG: hypothetical protein SGJ09_12545 [Phycisphaerae bacterium]|nr:hypothetical protein [Phycisphaerae bacterium]